MSMPNSPLSDEDEKVDLIRSAAHTAGRSLSTQEIRASLRASGSDLSASLQALALPMPPTPPTPAKLASAPADVLLPARNVRFQPSGSLGFQLELPAAAPAPSCGLSTGDKPQRAKSEPLPTKPAPPPTPADAKAPWLAGMAGKKPASLYLPRPAGLFPAFPGLAEQKSTSSAGAASLFSTTKKLVSSSKCSDSLRTSGDSSFADELRDLDDDEIPGVASRDQPRHCHLKKKTSPSFSHHLYWRQKQHHL